MKSRLFGYPVLKYIIFLGGILYFYSFKIDLLQHYGSLLVSSFLLFLIHDFILYFYTLPQTKSPSFNLSQIRSDYKSQKISHLVYWSILNRIFIFPTLLCFYLILLLINQTNIFSLSLYITFIPEQLILIVVVFSGIMTLFFEKNDESYISEKYSSQKTLVYVSLCIALSCIGSYIVSIQTLSLGIISYPISLLSGVIIFLVGISLLEEGDNTTNRNIVT